MWTTFHRSFMIRGIILCYKGLNIFSTLYIPKDNAIVPPASGENIPAVWGKTYCCNPIFMSFKYLYLRFL